MNTPNKSYWIKRAAQLEQAIQNEAAPSVENIKCAYEAAIRSINADMQKILIGFAQASDITEAEAKKLINAAQSRELYKDLVKLYDETEDAAAKKEIAIKINRQAYGARMSRLEALKQKIYIHLMSARNTETAEHAALHSETLKRSYYTSIDNIAKGFNAGVSFSVLPKRAIEKALSADWLGSNYSKRIWNNNRQFIDKVQRTVTDGITAGHSISRMSEQLLDYVTVEGTGQRYITERLVRSETAHFMAEGQLEAYKSAGIEEYQFVAALSERTCDTCGGLDGEVFPISQARAGDNYPPIHANCRCTTILARFTPSARIARNPENGKNYKIDGSKTYTQWKNSLTPEQKAAMDLHVRQMKNKSADMKQYEKYIKVLGAENMPKTFDKFRETKYNDIEKMKSLKLAYSDKSLQNKIRSEYNLTIHEGRQGKHILGHNNYTEGRSYITISLQEAQELINQYAGTGIIKRDRHGVWEHKELFKHDSEIGVIINADGEKNVTSKFTIHYSKTDGAHIVPGAKGLEDNNGQRINRN